MSARITIAPSVLDWAVTRSGREEAKLTRKFPKWRSWYAPQSGPTPKQLENFADYTGIPFGYFLLREPPELRLPVADFREGHTGGWERPSPELLAVVYQSVRRQDWYRDYAADNGLPPVEVVGSGQNKAPVLVAQDMRERLHFEVATRKGTWNDTRKHLLRAFEDLGGLTVATSMVENNTYRMLDPDEFRGFSLIDELAPLVFVNASQTLNGQIFTLAHELAHVWRGTSGIGAEDLRREPQTEVEMWCNAVASEFLVPEEDLQRRHALVADIPLEQRLDQLAHVYKCGTLVVLQAIHRTDLEQFEDFDASYDREVSRLARFEQKGAAQGNHYANQPYRVGDRLSRAIIRDAIEGRTPMVEAMRLMSMRSPNVFNEYARRLGVA